MTAAARLEADLERLRQLEQAAAGRLRLQELPSASSQRLTVELHYATAATPRYPLERSERTLLSVALPSRYPFAPPVATIRTPIWHPNVYVSGIVCLGARWLPSEGLDLYLQRITRLVCFDPLLVNTASPANREAAAWYAETRRRHPAAFPTDQPQFAPAPTPRSRARPGWTDRSEDAARVERSCTHCGRTLRLPPGRAGRVRCPACGQSFATRT